MQNTIEILVGGKPIRQYAHNNRIYVIGIPGQEYSVKVRNHHASRKLVSVTVDSINVVDGEVGSKQGYVLAGYSNYDIKGFRTSNSEVASFKFAPKHKSYAAKTDATNFSTQDCGVIGLVVFDEKEKPLPVFPPLNVEYHYHYPDQPIWWFPGYGTYTTTWSDNSHCNTTIPHSIERGPVEACNSTSTSALENNAKPFDLGTAWGEAKYDYVTNTEFETGPVTETVDIFYASRESLLAMGVDLDKSTAVNFPRSFPNGFCKPPK